MDILRASNFFPLFCVPPALCLTGSKRLSLVKVIWKHAWGRYLECHKEKVSAHSRFCILSQAKKFPTSCIRLTHIVPTSRAGFTHKLYKLQLWASHYKGPEWGHLTKKKKKEHTNNGICNSNWETYVCKVCSTLYVPFTKEKLLNLKFSRDGGASYVLQPGGHPALPTRPCHWTLSRNFWICFTSWCLISFPRYLYPENVFQSGVRTEILRHLMMWIPYKTSWT